MSTQSHPLALRCQGLVKRYGALTAVDGLDLEVRRGECFGLLGPNGAGKTTTVEILEGLNEADAGTIELLGTPLTAKTAPLLRERLGIALQETQFADKLTVGEVVRMFRSFYKDGRSVDEVIALVELESKRTAHVGKLSGGQRQRLALACALVGKPELLFLDEPTTGLDPQARLKLWELVERFIADGGTVVLTTHYMDEAARLCHRIAVVDHGKRIAQGTPRELIASLDADQIIEVRTRPRLQPEVLAGLVGVRSVREHDDHLVLSVDDAAVIGRVIEAVRDAGSVVENLVTHEATLEDVFVHLTGRGLRDG